MIKIRTFFPVNLDIDEIAVHQRGNCRIFKTLPFHYMAPMAGSIAYANQYRLLLRPGSFQRLLSPGVPFNRVVCMLQ